MPVACQSREAARPQCGYASAARLYHDGCGLFFAYDLLGYGMLALSTFFLGLSLQAETRADK